VQALAFAFVVPAFVSQVNFALVAELATVQMAQFALPAADKA